MFKDAEFGTPRKQNEARVVVFVKKVLQRYQDLNVFLISHNIYSHHDIEHFAP